MKFLLGTHMAHWLGELDVSLIPNVVCQAA